jgi:predicted GIY-YIG superfamily endonuclease
MSNTYNNGKIYKLVCEDGHYYIGSTVQLKLNLVINYHKRLSKNNTSRLYQHINTIGWDKVYIEVIQNYSCNNKNELTMKEEEIINTSNNDFLCLNNDIEDSMDDDSVDEDSVDEDMSDYESMYSSDSENDIYQNGKIYKLTCKDGHYYIGSTTKTLQKRFTSHKCNISKNTGNGNYTYFSSVPIDDIQIELIECYPCSSKKELREREDYYILLSLSDKYCLNTFRAFQTDEEKKEYDRLYYSLYKDKAKENMKKYYEKNKEEIIESHRDYNKQNREKVDAYQAQYRLENAEKRREYTRQYTQEHSEQVKEYKKKYNEDNKDKLNAYWREYTNKDENKERIRETKRKSAQKMKEQNAETTTKEREEKKAIREKKKQSRIKHDRTIVQCACGGSYQNYQKKRHEESKKHLSFTA